MTRRSDFPRTNSYVSEVFKKNELDENYLTLLKKKKNWS